MGSLAHFEMNSTSKKHTYCHITNGEFIIFSVIFNIFRPFFLK